MPIDDTIQKYLNRAMAAGMNDAQIDDARAKAEIAIEKILLDLEETTGCKIDEVSVDVRNFANCDVEIWFWKDREQ